MPSVKVNKSRLNTSPSRALAKAITDIRKGSTKPAGEKTKVDTQTNTKTNTNKKTKTKIVIASEESGAESQRNPKFSPGQIVVTKGGKRYIVDQDRRFVPMTSKKNPQREDQANRSRRRNSARIPARPKSNDVSAPRAGSLLLINGQTFVVGEDRKTFIPITPSVAGGQGVLTTLLEVAAVVLIADLVVDLIVDDIALDNLAQAASFGSVGSFDAGDVGNFDGFGDGWDAGDFFF